MNDQIEIKDLDEGLPVQEDWLVFQKVSDGVVYKAPKSDIEGEDAFVYIAYADDDIGTGFTLTFDANKDYIAIKSTNTEIANPVVGDFAGLWKNYKGAKGDTGDKGDQGIQGIQGPQGIQGVAGNDGTDGISFIWKDAYDNATTYQANDTVSYNGSSYICILESTGHLPTDTTYWSLMAQKGVDGEGSGDMLASVYDPTSIKSDAFDMDNMVEGTNNKLVSSAEKTTWNNKLDDITGESIADLSDVDSIAGITDGKVLKWDTDKFVVADDNDTTYTASDFDIKDLTDSANLRATWSGKQNALGFTPEDVANKVTSFQGTPDNSHYPSEKLVKDGLDGKQNTLVSTQKTILTTDWSDKEATISVSGITTASIVFVSPSPASYEDYVNSEIRATSLGSGTITFACTEEPTEDVIINLVF